MLDACIHKLEPIQQMACTTKKKQIIEKEKTKFGFMLENDFFFFFGSVNMP